MSASCADGSARSAVQLVRARAAAWRAAAAAGLALDALLLAVFVVWRDSWRGCWGSGGMGGQG